MVNPVEIQCMLYCVSCLLKVSDWDRSYFHHLILTMGQSFFTLRHNILILKVCWSSAVSLGNLCMSQSTFPGKFRHIMYFTPDKPWDSICHDIRDITMSGIDANCCCCSWCNLQISVLISVSSWDTTIYLTGKRGSISASEALRPECLFCVLSVFFYVWFFDDCGGITIRQRGWHNGAAWVEVWMECVWMSVFMVPCEGVASHPGYILASCPVFLRSAVNPSWPWPW